MIQDMKRRFLVLALTTGAALTACAKGDSPEGGAREGDGASVTDAGTSIPDADAALDGHVEAGPEIPRDGLVGEWLLDGDALDTSGNLNHGAALGGAAPAADRFGRDGRAMHFDGVEARIEVAHAPSLDVTGEHSICAWFRPDSLGPLRGLVSKYRSVGAEGPTLRLSYTAPYDVIDLNESSSHAQGSIAKRVTAGSWQHVCALATSDGVEIYLDGVLAYRGTAGFVAKANADSLAIGMDYQVVGDDRRFFHGAIDDVRIYARALTVSEVHVLFGSEP
jgi:hypothetical protein